MRASIRKHVAVMSSVIVVSLLVGCAQASIVMREYDGFSEGTDPPLDTPTTDAVALAQPDLGPRVQWAAQSGVIAVSLWGSSSCPTEPTAVEVAGRNRLAITTRTRTAFLAACTADLAVRTYEIRVPTSVSTSQPLTVVVAGHTLTLRADG